MWINPKDTILCKIGCADWKWELPKQVSVPSPLKLREHHRGRNRRAWRSRREGLWRAAFWIWHHACSMSPQQLQQPAMHLYSIGPWVVSIINQGKLIAPPPACWNINYVWILKEAATEEPQAPVDSKPVAIQDETNWVTKQKMKRTECGKGLWVEIRICGTVTIMRCRHMVLEKTQSVL